MTKLLILSSTLVLLLLLPETHYGKTAGTREDLLRQAVYVAGYMETFRQLPPKTNAAEFLYLAATDITQPDGRELDSALTTLPAGLKPPVHPYVFIDFVNKYYERPYRRQEYQSFFEKMLRQFRHSAVFPASMQVESNVQVRFVEAVYYAAGILRAEYILGRRPALWRKYIIAPKGLVPWTTPRGYERWTAALTHDYGDLGSPYTAKRYYASSAHHYEMFQRAKGAAGGAKDPYLAAQRIHNWVKYQWLQRVGYSVGRMPFGLEMGGYEKSGYFYHTSGPPRIIVSDLLRAIGIPASSAGAAYFEDRGWVNSDIHATFGSAPRKNRFYDDEIPPPTKNLSMPSPKDHFALEISDLSHRRTGAPEPFRKMVFVNPSDIHIYGPQYVVDQSGDADIIILTVKTAQGTVFFRSDSTASSQGEDALGPLLATAHKHGKMVYAAVSTLIDRQAGIAHPEWRQRLNSHVQGSESWPNIHISPCVEQYRAYLKQQLHNLVSRYNVDGVVLSGLYFANLFGNLDTYGHANCPSGQRWMDKTLTEYARDLVQTIHTINNKIDTVLMSHPLLDAKNRYFDLTSEKIGHQNLVALTKVVDHVMLVIPGTSWVARGAKAPVWNGISELYRGSGRRPWISITLVDEWEYSSAFYRGLRNVLSTKFPLGGFGLHTPLSAVGELAPAFTKTLWWKIRHLSSMETK